MTPHNRHKIYKNIGIYFAAFSFLIFALFPFAWMLVTSIKPADQIYTSPPTWTTSRPTLTHYQNVLFNTDVPVAFKNTLKVALITTFIALLVGILAAYGFARMRFKGKGFLALFILFTQMIPQMVILIPLYNFLSYAGLINTLFGLTFPYLGVTLPLMIWMLRGFFAGIPQELEEAAMIDGCSRLAAVFKIIVPISIPAIIATSIYCFNNIWQEFVFALNFTTTTQTKTISVFVMDMMGENAINWGDITAASTMSTLPVIILFLMVHKYFLQGVVDGSVKG